MGVERAYAKSLEVTLEKEAEILSEQFTMPKTCTKEECPYICEEFITPQGVSIEDILGRTAAQEGMKTTGFLSSISEDLKVKFSNKAESIVPAAIATTLDTSVESTQEILMTEVEKKLL